MLFLLFLAMCSLGMAQGGTIKVKKKLASELRFYTFERSIKDDTATVIKRFMNCGFQRSTRSKLFTLDSFKSNADTAWYKNNTYWNIVFLKRDSFELVIMYLKPGTVQSVSLYCASNTIFTGERLFSESLKFAYKRLTGVPETQNGRIYKDAEKPTDVINENKMSHFSFENKIWDFSLGLAHRR
jgi:hypothetical protein